LKIERGQAVTKLKTLYFKKKHEIVVYKGVESGELWFTRNDIGSALGYSNPRKAIGKMHDRTSNTFLDDNSDKIPINYPSGGVHFTTVYNLEGLRRLCVRSRKDDKLEFFNFVKNEVDKIKEQDKVLTRDEYSGVSIYKTYKMSFGPDNIEIRSFILEDGREYFSLRDITNITGVGSGYFYSLFSIKYSPVKVRPVGYTRPYAMYTGLLQEVAEIIREANLGIFDYIEDEEDREKFIDELISLPETNKGKVYSLSNNKEQQDTVDEQSNRIRKLEERINQLEKQLKIKDLKEDMPALVDELYENDMKRLWDNFIVEELQELDEKIRSFAVDDKMAEEILDMGINMVDEVMNNYHHTNNFSIVDNIRKKNLFIPEEIKPEDVGYEFKVAVFKFSNKYIIELLITCVENLISKFDKEDDISKSAA